MATLQIRDLPEHIHRELIRQAEQERRSLAQQAVVVRAKALAVDIDPKARRREALARIKRTINRAETQNLPDVVKMIREDRDR